MASGSTGGSEISDSVSFGRTMNYKINASVGCHAMCNIVNELKTMEWQRVCYTNTRVMITDCTAPLRSVQDTASMLRCTGRVRRAY